jgi:hypothetical protein
MRNQIIVAVLAMAAVNAAHAGVVFTYDPAPTAHMDFTDASCAAVHNLPTQIDLSKGNLVVVRNPQDTRIMLLGCAVYFPKTTDGSPAQHGGLVLVGIEGSDKPIAYHLDQLTITDYGVKSSAAYNAGVR